jgi:hypothetical protein
MNTGRNVALLFTVAVLGGAQACATASQPAELTLSAPLQGEPSHRTGVPGRIVAADLPRVQGATALDAIRELRPEFLHLTGRRTGTASAPPAPSVYENGKYAGGIDVLNIIPIRVVLEIRRVEAVEAKSLFGSSCQCDGGIILIRTQP